MTITRRIAAIHNPAVRVPLWTTWFVFFRLPDMVMSACLDGEAPRLLSRRLWELAWACFLIGIDGLED